MDVSRHEDPSWAAPRATAFVDLASPDSALRARLGVERGSWLQGTEILPAGQHAGTNDRPRPMPPLAREGLERALCRVLERRHPGVRFAMKDKFNAAGQRTASSGDTDSLKDRL